MPLPVEPVARWVAARGGRHRRRAGGDRVLLLVALALFAAAFVGGLRALPDDVDVHVRWPLLAVVALVAVPATTAVNALEYAAIGRIDGRRVDLRSAVEVSVLSSAANLLPIPGAALVRARALRRLGSTYGRALSATAVVGLAWLATALVVAGGLLLGGGEDGASVGTGAGALVAGLAGAVVSTALVRRLAGPARWRPAAALVVGVELLGIAVGVARYLLVIHGLGLDVTVAQAAALTVAPVVASAVGFLPGGLGLRELLAAAISPAVGLPAAVGLVGTAVDRLVGLPVLGLAAGALVAANRSGDGTPAAAAPDPG